MHDPASGNSNDKRNVGYVGNKGTHVFAGNGPSYNTNEAAIGQGTFAYGCTANPAPQRVRLQTKLHAVYAAIIPATAFPKRRSSFTYPGSTFTDAQGVVHPTPACCSDSPGDYFGNDADNKYNALQVKVEKRVSNGLQFLAHYTYSRLISMTPAIFQLTRNMPGTGRLQTAIKCLWSTLFTNCRSVAARNSWVTRAASQIY